MTKTEAISMLLSLEDDEPVFILRAKDKVAPYIVNMWMGAACLAGMDANTAVLAMDLSREMESWQKIHGKETPNRSFITKREPRLDFLLW